MGRLAQAGYQAWAVDLIGFGQSDKPGDGWYSLDRYTRTLSVFFEQMGLDRPAVVGHSMGGTIALDLAVRRKTRALLAVAPVVNGALSYSLNLLLTSPIARWLFGWTRKRTFFSMLGEMKLVATPGLFRDPVRRRNHQDLRATTVNAAVGSLRTVVSSNLEQELPGIGAPTLILVGGRDAVVSPSQGKLAGRLIPQAQLVVWPDATHQLIDERGDDFDALMLDHLGTALARRRADAPSAASRPEP
jgi:pimeloyl-ACP methyl ester carboxylesterase